MTRSGEPEELARSVFFLVSGDSSRVNAVELKLDAGATERRSELPFCALNRGVCFSFWELRDRRCSPDTRRSGAEALTADHALQDFASQPDSIGDRGGCPGGPSDRASRRKGDKLDVHTLARLARTDPELLSSIEHPRCWRKLICRGFGDAMRSCEQGRV